MIVDIKLLHSARRDIMMWWAKEYIRLHNLPDVNVYTAYHDWIDYKLKFSSKMWGYSYEHWLIRSEVCEPIYEEDKQAKLWNVKCPSCNQYFPWSHPEHWYTMCEDCVW